MGASIRIPEEIRIGGTPIHRRWINPLVCCQGGLFLRCGEGFGGGLFDGAVGEGVDPGFERAAADAVVASR